MKKLLASKMKDVPKADQDKVFALLDKNPDLFKKIAEESQKKMQSGMGQMEAVMAVMKQYESELKNIL